MDRRYCLTLEGKKHVRIPKRSREPVLDHLYEFRTATRDELRLIDKSFDSKIRKFKTTGLVQEV